jgi:hypothetical protein
MKKYKFRNISTGDVIELLEDVFNACFKDKLSEDKKTILNAEGIAVYEIIEVFDDTGAPIMTNAQLFQKIQQTNQQPSKSCNC